MGDVVDYCATRRRAIAKWIQVLNSSCQICLETLWTNLLIVVGGFKVRDENREVYSILHNHQKNYNTMEMRLNSGCQISIYITCYSFQ